LRFFIQFSSAPFKRNYFTGIKFCGFCGSIKCRIIIIIYFFSINFRNSLENTFLSTT